MQITMPCLSVRLVERGLLRANTWNPNHVSPDKMDLLRQSILDNGFCFPIVTIADDAEGCFVIVDGFHRYTICQPEWLDIDPVPIVVLGHDVSKQQIATVQFNKARGVHQVDLDAEIVRRLVAQGQTAEEVSVSLGLEIDAVHRLLQVAGVAELFRSAEYSTAWEMVDE